VCLTVICTDVHTPSSGMLPGYVSGHYSYDEAHIDLPRLAVFAGARLYRDDVVGIDRAGGKVLCRNRPPLPYDRVSINIGSTPHLSGVLGAGAGGFVLVNDQLQTLTDLNIFAAGDIAAMPNYPLEKAGVFAVRMGLPLAGNLRRNVQGRTLHAYQPQSNWLALISTGNCYANTPLNHGAPEDSSYSASLNLHRASKTPVSANSRTRHLTPAP